MQRKSIIGAVAALWFILLAVVAFAASRPGDVLLMGVGAGAGGGGGGAITLVSGQFATATNGGQANTVATTLTGVTSGNTVVLAFNMCSDASCAGNTAVSISGVTATAGSCSAISGAQATGVTQSTAFTFLWVCQGGSGSQTYTATMTPSGQSWYATIFAQEFHNVVSSTPAEGGSFCDNAAVGTSYTCTTGTLTQSSGELVISTWASGASFGTLTLGGGQTNIGTSGNAFSYQITSGCSSCTVTHTYNTTSSVTNAISIGALKHS